MALRGKLWINTSGFHGCYSHFHEGHVSQRGWCWKVCKLLGGGGGSPADPCRWFPWHPGPMWAMQKGSDSSKLNAMFPPQCEADWRDEGKHSLNRKKKKKHLFKTSKEQNAPWPFLQSSSRKSHIIIGQTLPDSFATLMRRCVRVNKTPLFCLLVSQTRSLASDPCCDPACRRGTVPQGCTPAELSDVLI